MCSPHNQYFLLFLANGESGAGGSVGGGGGSSVGGGGVGVGVGAGGMMSRSVPSSPSDRKGGAGGGGGKPAPDGYRSEAYSFDSTALERAAKAAKVEI